MDARDYPQRRKASEMLLLATIFWGVSFPVMRALSLAQEQLLPAANSWFMTSAIVAVRFSVSALILIPWCWRTLRQLTWLEVWQGIGLGFFGGAGILLQMDGLAYTPASTSAFLTQSYCVLIPLIVAVRERRLPSWIVCGCTALVMIGVAVLARFDWREFKLGRGEWETLLGSIFFAAQMLWLERPGFAANRVSHFSLVMFLVMALLAAPVCAVTMNEPGDLLVFFRSPLVIALTAVLVLACTMVANLLMNRWQPQLSATEAGLIYAVEPVFASLFAMCLPAWLSAWGGFDYANERFTPSLLLGGGLILAANTLIQFQPRGEGKAMPANQQS
ncbi:MAG: DMT family transporter [Verrucomicrobia bacterium]|nr:DMT family transporter [Verrucomicrobiota bacterium]